jgi:hypothetical protein
MLKKYLKIILLKNFIVNMEMNNKKKQYNNYNGLKNNFNLNEIILMDFFSYFTCNLKH